MSKKTCRGCEHLKLVCGIAEPVVVADGCICFAKKPENLFDRITASPEVLAEKLVYQRNSKVIHQNDKCTLEYWTFSWKSSVIKGQSFETREKAIAATLEKLKEVENG